MENGSECGQYGSGKVEDRILNHRNIVAAIGCLALVACGEAPLDDATPTARPVKTMIVESPAGSGVRNFPGRIDSANRADLAFRGEKQDLEEMIGNLTENACKWAKSRVTIDVTQTPASKRTDDRDLRFIVEDDGPGMNEEEMAVDCATGPDAGTDG